LNGKKEILMRGTELHEPSQTPRGNGCFAPLVIVLGIFIYMLYLSATDQTDGLRFMSCGHEPAASGSTP
jgi:hypothetical protein